MTPEEFGARSAELKAQYEAETRELEEKLVRARVQIERLETRLGGIREQYQRRVSELTATFLGLPVPDRQVLASDTVQSASGAEPGRKKRRGMLDGPILELARELSDPDVSAGQVEEVWNQRNPSNQITGSTVRGILDRMVDKGLLQVSEPGGGRGSGIPKKYRTTS